MPKKTRKEKIAARERKKLRILQQSAIKTVTQPAPAVQEIVPETTVVYKHIELSKEEKQITDYFFIDLKKSLILITIVIALEISLYFATINHYLKF